MQKHKKYKQKRKKNYANHKPMHAEKFFNPKLGLDEVDAVRNQSSDNT